MKTNDPSKLSNTCYFNLILDLKVYLQVETKLTKVFFCYLINWIIKIGFLYLNYSSSVCSIIIFFTEVTVSLKHCSYCGNIFTPETCRVRIRPKLTLNRNMSKLLERHKENPEALSKYQRNLVQRYLRSKNVLVCMLSATWIEKS